MSKDIWKTQVTTMETPSPWRTVRALAAELNDGSPCPVFSDDSLRHLVRHAEANGLAPHVRRVGAKVLIHAPGFMDWVNKQPTSRPRRRR